MQAGVFISVRMKSSRLPGKALLEIEGKPAVEHLVERAKRAAFPQRVVVCTSVHPDDAVLADLAKKTGVDYFQGSEDDKLDRYLRAAESFGLDLAIIVDGDDICCEPEYMDEVVIKYKETGADFITCRGLPLGTSCSGISTAALRKVCEVKDETDTEVWGGYFTETGLFKVEFIDAPPELNRPEIRMTLDYQEDLDFFREVFKELYVPGQVFHLRSVIQLLDGKPEIIEINKGVQKAYEENLKKSAPVKIKSA